MKNRIPTILILLVFVILAISTYVVFVNKNEEETANTAESDQTTQYNPEIENNIEEETEELAYVDITVKEAYELIRTEESLIILDVSNRYEQGHIPNAINYYVGDGSLDTAIPTLDPDDTYLVYCHVDKIGRAHV